MRRVQTRLKSLEARLGLRPASPEEERARGAVEALRSRINARRQDEGLQQRVWRDTWPPQRSVADILNAGRQACADRGLTA